MKNQMKLPVVHVSAIVLECVVDFQLTTLPLAKSHGIAVGDLFCFRDSYFDGDEKLCEYVYATAISVNPWYWDGRGVASETFHLVKFRVLKNLDAVVIP